MASSLHIQMVLNTQLQTDSIALEECRSVDQEDNKILRELVAECIPLSACCVMFA